MRRGALAGAVALLALALALAPAHAAPAELTDIEDEVMCVTCGIPLNVAEGGQPDGQREFIRGLIAEGRTKEQIKSALVAEYGERVLALPADSGFGLTAYVVPPALVAALAGGLLLLLPRWRRRSAAGIGDAHAPALDDGDRDRLAADLARYER